LIYFYSTKEEPYGCFSNFSPHRFQLDGLLWPTSEHYFQANKFLDQPHFHKIRGVASPMIAARLGRDRRIPLRPDWETVKDQVMRRAVQAKFEQNPVIRDVLLSTGHLDLVEKTTEDYYWGCGSDGTGQNKLGLFLMEVRSFLRAPKP
jgi:ribA/ribD-fused uncharacterized protein